MKKKFLITILFVLLAIGNIYFFIRSNKPDYNIAIGKPVDNEAVDFTNSESLRDKNDIDTVILSLIHADSISESDLLETTLTRTPDAEIKLTGSVENIAYLFSLWLEKDSIILKIDETYKELSFSDSPYGTELKDLVEKQLENYKK